jgi:hypothetical protein
MMEVSEHLREETATYEANREALIGSALNKYVLIHGTEVVATFDTESDAIQHGYRQFGNVPFLVRKVSPVEDTANYLSGIVAI